MTSVKVLEKSHLNMTLRQFHIDRNLGIYQQYQTTYLHAIANLGKRTAVLLQVGATYELFCVDVPSGVPSNNFFDISDIMNLTITHRGKGVLGSESNPHMSGFPTGAIRKYSNLLLSADYSVVICDHEDSDSDGHGKQRVITDIITPGTTTKTTGITANKLVVLYVENQNPKEVVSRVDRADLCIGMSSMNVITGETKLFELHTSPNHPKFGKQHNLEEVYRFLQSNNCRELVVHLKNFDISTNPGGLERQQAIETYLREVLALDQYYVQQFTFNQVDDSWTTQRYQTSVLERIFEGRSKIDLEYMSSAATAYLIILEHIRQRNPALVKHLPKPEIWTSNDVMILTHNAIQQLELCPSTSIDTKSRDRRLTLFDIVNSTTTAEGRRQLEQLLFVPYFDPNLLETKYAQVQAMIGMERGFIETLSKSLRSVGDLRKSHRRLETGTLSPLQLSKLITSYNVVFQIHAMISQAKNSLPTLNEEVLFSFREYLSTLNLMFSMERLSECKGFKSIHVMLLNEGLISELDALYSKVGNLDVMIGKLQVALARIVDSRINDADISKLVKIKKTASGDTLFEVPNRVKGLLEYYKSGMNRKYVDLQDFIYYNKDNLHDADLIECSEKMRFKRDYRPSDMIDMTQEELKLLASLKFTRMKSKTKVQSTIIRDIETNGTKYVDNFVSVMTSTYHSILPQIYDPYEETLRTIVHWIGQIDLVKSHALTAMKYNYCRPTAVANETELPSYIEASNVRHPIVERIHDHMRFVPNDVSLGNKEGFNNGLFLCSVNNGGKSTYLKSVGLNIIMAQCGMFVAASSFVFNPFKNMITRLSGLDNMYKRQGSFAVEMSELSTVMNQGTNKTLVLGDEICRGTETDSASDIVASSTYELCRRGINFIFSTHLTTVENVSEVADCVKQGRLRYAHFSTTILPDTQEVIFEHKLHEGSGQKLYGIEIAEVMGLDPAVISLAYKLRNRRQNPQTHAIPLGGDKKSRYNSKKLLGLCEIKDCERKAIDTHHINGQCTADDNGMIEHFHKNETHNLVGLCKECHNAVHVDKTLTIYGWKQTTQGNTKLLYVRKETEESK